VPNNQTVGEQRDELARPAAPRTGRTPLEVYRYGSGAPDEAGAIQSDERNWPCELSMTHVATRACAPVMVGAKPR